MIGPYVMEAACCQTGVFALRVRLDRVVGHPGHPELMVCWSVKPCQLNRLVNRRLARSSQAMLDRGIPHPDSRALVACYDSRVTPRNREIQVVDVGIELFAQGKYGVYQGEII